MERLLSPDFAGGDPVLPRDRALRAAVSSARFEDQVVHRVREYIAELLPEDLALIPPECRPGKIRDAEDIGSLAFTLSRAYCDSPSLSRQTEILAHMASFFSHAATRCADIAAMGEEVDDEAA